MASTKLGRILWAVDAFEASGEHASELQVLKHFLAPLGAQIEPVFVLSPSALGLAGFRSAEGLQALKEQAQKNLTELRRESESPQILEPCILTEEQAGVGAAIRRLKVRAQETGAGVVLIKTHGRKGLQRMFLGSFAESLILQSDRPVLVVGPGCQVPARVSTVLFPTDFGPSSHAALGSALQLARDFGAELVFYFKQPLIVDVSGTGILFSGYLEEEAGERQKAQKQWAEEARRAGVRARFEIDEQPGYPDHAILEAAKAQKADLIAMPTFADAVSAFVAGSTTRQVVRASCVPVWIFPESSKSKIP